MFVSIAVASVGFDLWLNAGLMRLGLLFCLQSPLFIPLNPIHSNMRTVGAFTLADFSTSSTMRNAVSDVVVRFAVDVPLPQVSESVSR